MLSQIPTGTPHRNYLQVVVQPVLIHIMAGPAQWPPALFLLSLLYFLPAGQENGNYGVVQPAPHLKAVGVWLHDFAPEGKEFSHK